MWKKHSEQASDWSHLRRTYLARETQAPGGTFASEGQIMESVFIVFSSQGQWLGVLKLQDDKNKAATDVAKHVALFVQQRYRIHFVQAGEGECFSSTASFFKWIIFIIRL